MDKILLKPMEVAESIGIGRTRMYDLLAAGEIPSVRLGRSIRIPAAALMQWVDERQSATATTSQGSEG